MTRPVVSTTIAPASLRPLGGGKTQRRELVAWPARTCERGEGGRCQGGREARWRPAEPASAPPEFGVGQPACVACRGWCEQGSATANATARPGSLIASGCQADSAIGTGAALQVSQAGLSRGSGSDGDSMGKSCPHCLARIRCSSVPCRPGDARRYRHRLPGQRGNQRRLGICPGRRIDVLREQGASLATGGDRTTYGENHRARTTPGFGQELQRRNGTGNDTTRGLSQCYRHLPS